MLSGARSARSAPAPFPWDDTLAFLLGVLGWPPESAWAATIPEIRLAARGRLGPGPASPPDAAALAALMAAFPDETGTGEL